MTPQTAARQAPAPDVDYAANAARWVTDEFQPSTLSEEEQLAELAWYTAASADLRGRALDMSLQICCKYDFGHQCFLDRRGCQ